MAVPGDEVTVMTAVRLGWCVAEVRGRNRPDPQPGGLAAMPGREGTHALPLKVERSPDELRIEAQVVLTSLAQRLTVNSDGPGGTHADFAQEVDDQAKALAEAREKDPDSAPQQWDALAELIFEFDAHIQDTMAARSDTEACGYQLGRALADSYWALDPALPAGTQSPAAWWFLLGHERASEMGRLVGRLSAYFPPYTGPAIAGSLRAWQNVAADPDWRANAGDALYRQVRRWYELLILRQDPTTLIQPYALMRNWRMVRRALRIFWPELALSALGAATLAGFAAVLGQKGTSAFLKTALGFLAITGFSIAGLSAKLKNQAQAMVTRLRQDVYTDLIAVDITTAPPAPAGSTAARAGQADIEQVVRERALTPATPN